MRDKATFTDEMASQKSHLPWLCKDQFSPRWSALLCFIQETHS